MNADTPGALYLGGNFTNAGGIAAADRIAKWNGDEVERPRHDAARQRVGLRDRAHAGKVYAGGTFVNAGGQAPADYLAVFDGVSWEPFCNATANPAFDAAGSRSSRSR